MRRWPALLLAAAISACNCGSDPGAVDQGRADAGGDDAGIFVCQADDDCALGLACIGGDCRERPDAGQVSGPDASLGCLTDEDCGDLRYACARSVFRCVRVPGRCLDDEDCAAGFLCETREHLCVVSHDAGVEPACLEGEVRGCGTSKIGECRYGIQTCAGGAFGECFGAVVPGPEACDGLDNSCDGNVDEGFDLGSDLQNCGECGHVCLFPHAQPLCAEGSCRLGPCDQGWTDLNGDPADGCEFSCTPTNGGLEACDGLDNDCNGAVDEGVCAPLVTCPGDQAVGPNANLTLATLASSPPGRPLNCAWSVVSRPATSNGSFTGPSCAGTGYFADVVGVHHLRFTATDNQGLSTSCETRITVDAQGDLWVELTWDRNNDMDLHFQHPSAGSSHAAAGWGSSASPHDCYYSNKTPSWDAAGTQDDPSLDRDDITGRGPENTRINVPSTAHPYTIGVHMFNDAGGTIDATVKLYCGNVLMTTEHRVFSTRKDLWVVGTVQFRADRTCAFTRDGFVFNMP